MHILYIVGNRPQFIKLAILHRKVKEFAFIKESVIHTGQHFSKEMSDVFFDELDIDLDVTNLSIHSLSQIAIIGRTLEALEDKLIMLQPDMVIVFGDTNATLAGALAAKKLNIPIAHFEAGIRTFEEEMPEESNRYITDRIASINFCCTYMGVQHLQREGFTTNNIKSRVVNSGDLMLDAFYYYKKQISKQYNNDIRKDYGDAFILATIHRRQNIENGIALKEIVTALNEIHKSTPIVCPLHPFTKLQLEKYNIVCDFYTLPATGYLRMLQLLNACHFVITDSGGLQREAFFADKPTLILMDKPFWPETILHGNAECSLSEKENILMTFERLKSNNTKSDVSVFGNGDAASIIIQEMINFHTNKL